MQCSDVLWPVNQRNYRHYGNKWSIRVTNRKPRIEPPRHTSITIIVGLRDDISRRDHSICLMMIKSTLQTTISNGDDRITTAIRNSVRTDILSTMTTWLALAGAPRSMHNQLRIILMDITLNGLLCIRIILGWLCMGSPPLPPGLVV